MIRPNNFGFNRETAESNTFQKDLEIADLSIKAQNEFDQMADVLQSKGIALRIFEDQEIALPDAVFSNNWISHLPTGQLCIYPMFTANRRAEVRMDIVEWCRLELDVDTIIDLTEMANHSRFLEGTGSIVFDHQNKIAYSCISPRTDLSLLEEFCQSIGYRAVSFESVSPQGGQIYHTNVMMSIGSKLVMVCLESIENILERKMLVETLKKSGRSIVELNYQQMNQFAGNALEVANELGEALYVMSTTAYNSLNQSQREEISANSEIVSIDIPTIELIGGGSVRCMMTGLFNYSK